MLKLLLVIPMIISGIIGSMIVGSIEDYVTAQIQNIPNQIVDCNSMNTLAWKEACESQKITYNKGITLSNIVGFIAGFSTAGGVISKIT